jgi:hypothetical protein
MRAAARIRRAKGKVMRCVAPRALRFALRLRPALLWSGAALISMSLWRASAMLLSDISADWAEEALDGWVGRAGHWIVLSLVMMGYAVHALRHPAKVLGVALPPSAETVGRIKVRIHPRRRIPRLSISSANRISRARATPRKSARGRLRKSF